MAAKAKPTTKRKPPRAKGQVVETRTAALKRERFTMEYLLDFNVTRAAIAAGYSMKTAHAAGSRLLKDVRVASIVAAAQQKTSSKYAVTKDAVIEELAKLAFANVSDFGSVGADGEFRIDLSRTTRDQMAAVQDVRSKVKRTTIGEGKGATTTVDVETQLRLANKREALVDLGRHLGVFKDDGAPAMTVSFTISGLDDLKVKRTA